MTSGKVGEAFVELHYRLDTLQKDLGQAKSTVTSQVDQLKREVETRSQGMFGSVNTQIEGISSKLGVIGGLAVTAFAVQGARAVGQFATAIAEAGSKVQLMQARLAQALGSNDAFDLAVASANKLGISISSVAETMQRFGMAGREIGLTTDEVQKLTEVVIQLGRISGSGNQELSAGMYQLSQSLAAGRLNGDELRSVMENIPAVARTIAAALGVSVGELRDMGAAGQLTADVVSKALLGAADDVAAQFAKLPETLEQSQARWDNASTQLMAALDNALHVSDFYKFLTGGMAKLMEQAAVSLGGGDAGAQDRVLSDRLAQLRGGDSGGFTNSESANRAEIADLERKLGELRLSQFSPVDQAPFVDIGTGKVAEAPKTKAQQAQDQANLDASIKLRQEIEERNIKIQQDSLKQQLDDFEENQRLKKAAAEKAASEARSAANAAQSDAKSIIKQAMSAADTYTATVERLDGYLKKGQISQQTYNEAVAGAKQALDEANAAAARKEAADQEREANAARRAAKDRERADEKLRRDHEEQQAAVQKQMDQWKQQDPRGYFQATEDPELARIYDLQSGVEGAFQDMQDSALEFGRIGGQAVTQMADIASGAIADWVMGSKMDLDELAKALQKQVIMQFLQIAIKGAIGAGFGAAFGGGGGGTDTISTSYTGGKGYGGGYNGDYSNYARGGVFDHGSVVPLARGGIVNGGQLVPLSRGAALIGEAGPEGVLPLRRNSRGQLGVMNSGAAGGGGGGSGAQLVVNDMRGAGAQPIETRERRGPDGTRVIEATIRDTSRKQISRGDHDAAFGERYGMKTTPVK